MLKATLFVSSLLFANVTLADEVLGSVTEFEGKVTLHKEGSPRGKRIKSAPTELTADQFIRTYSNSKARIKLADDSKVLVTESSTLEFKDDQNIAVNSGRVLFSINKREATRSLNILTKTAVIGVKGTKFLVEANAEEAFLHLQEGEVFVESVAQEFEDYKAEFEKFKRQHLQEFNEFKKQLSITSGTSLSLGKGGLKKVQTPDKIEQLFAELDSF